MTELFKLVGKFVFDNEEGNNELDNTTNKAEKSESKISSAFKKLAGVVATAFAVDKIVSFGKQCVQMASDVEEMENKFNVVFDGMTDEVDQWATKYADSIGRNRNTIKGYLADNQNMFVGMGMTRQAGAELSEQMVSLALDLASFNNLNETDAVNALSKALMGETESAKSLGAVLNENTIAMAMETMGIHEKFDALSEAEKMEVRYQAILMQSQDAIGDCERSVDSFKGRQLQLTSATENLKEQIGSYFLPVLANLMSKATELVNVLASQVEPTMQKVQEVAQTISDFWNSNLVPALTSVKEGFLAVWEAFQPVIQEFTDLLPEVEMNVSGMDLLQMALQTVESVLLTLADGLKTVAEWMQKHQTLVTVLVTVIGSFAVAWGLVTTALTAWNVVCGIATAVTTGLAGAVAFLTSPITIVIAIIGALIAVGVLLYKNWDTIKEKAIQIFGAVRDWFGTVVENIKQFFVGLGESLSAIWDTIKSVIQVALDFLVNLFTLYIELITLPWRFLWENFGGVITEAWNTIVSFLQGVLDGIIQFITTTWNNIVNAVTTAMNAISSVITTIWNAIVSFVQPILTAIWTVVVTIFENIKTAISDKLNQAKDTISTIFNAVKTVISSVTSAIWSVVSTAFENVKTAISTKLNQAKQTVTSIFTSIKDTINNMMESAKTIVTNAVQKLKDAFNFSWELPKIKLPHFSISGKFSLDPPSVPSFGIEWYKNGGILTDPTAFGINPMTGKMMVGGEAGDEAILPIDNLKVYVSEAVAEQNASLVDVLIQILEAILSLDDSMGGKMREALEGLNWKMNNREFARLVKGVN